MKSRKIWRTALLILGVLAGVWVFGALLLGERMSGREIAGCALMFAAIVLAQLPGAKKEE